MSDHYLTKEAQARFERIAPALHEAGWVMQRFKKLNLAAGEAIAARVPYPVRAAANDGAAKRGS